jgi:hypothetical protein
MASNTILPLTLWRAEAGCASRRLFFQLRVNLGAHVAYLLDRIPHGGSTDAVLPCDISDFMRLLARAARWPRFSSSGMVLCQHQAPWNAP